MVGRLVNTCFGQDSLKRSGCKEGHVRAYIRTDNRIKNPFFYSEGAEGFVNVSKSLDQFLSAL
jgi:hypothetical protein